MANAVYPKAKAAMLSGAVDVVTGTVKIQLLGTDAVYDATDEFLADLVGTQWGSAVTITSKDVTGGEFTGSNGTFTLPEGTDIAAAVVFLDSGVAATSRLLAWIDRKADTSSMEFTATSQPFQPVWQDPYFSLGG